MISAKSRLLFLTFTAVFVEIFFCIWGLFNIPSLWQLPLLLGSYHSGYILARYKPFSNGGMLNSTILILAALIIATSIHTTNWLLLLLGLPLFSATIQGVRRILKSQCKIYSSQKNLVKLLAMMLSSLALMSSFSIVLIFFAISTIAFFACYSTKGRLEYSQTTNLVRKGSILLWFEFLHHAHYFIYCYTFWVILPRFMYLYVGLLFPIGWLGYWILEALLREKTNYFEKNVLAAGHLVNAVAIVTMPFGNIFWVIIMWFVTGIGGGTAYMLSNIPPTGDREFFEDFGHVIGCLIASLSIWVTKDPNTPLWIGAILAIASSIMLLFWKRPAILQT